MYIIKFRIQTLIGFGFGLGLGPHPGTRPNIYFFFKVNVWLQLNEFIKHKRNLKIEKVSHIIVFYCMCPGKFRHMHTKNPTI